MLKLKGGQRLPMHDVIPTPSFGLNHVLGGGLWTGRFHTFWGNPSAGKSTLALQTMANAQEQGYIPYIIDSEGSITDVWMEKCGVDLNKREMIRGTVVNDILSEVLPDMRKTGAKHVFLFDSINTMVADQFYKEDDSQGGLSMYARSQTFMLQKLAHEVVSNTNHLVILIAQQTMDMSGMYPSLSPKIGNAVNHWNSNTIRFFSSTGKAGTERNKDGMITDHEVKWTITKSKQRAVLGTKGDFWYNPATAEVNTKREIFDIAARNKLIVQKGPWFEINGQSYQGKEKAMAELTDDMWEKIKTDLTGKVELEFDIDEETAMGL